MMHYLKQCRIIRHYLKQWSWWPSSMINMRHQASIDVIHKSHNAQALNPTMHHFVTEMCTCVHISVTKWCIVGKLSNALWDGFVRWVYWRRCPYVILWYHPNNPWHWNIFIYTHSQHLRHTNLITGDRCRRTIVRTDVNHCPSNCNERTSERNVNRYSYIFSKSTYLTILATDCYANLR